MIAASAIASAKLPMPASEKAGDGDLAGMSPQGIATLDFADPLELLKCRIEIGAVGDDREIEQSAAYRPASLIPFGSSAISIGPGIGGIIEGAGIDDRPIQEIVAGIVRIFVVIEYVDDGELADGND